MTSVNNNILKYSEWRLLMLSEDGGFYRFSEQEKTYLYSQYLFRILERKLIMIDEQQKEIERLRRLIK